MLGLCFSQMNAKHIKLVQNHCFGSLMKKKRSGIDAMASNFTSVSVVFLWDNEVKVVKSIKK